MMEQHQLLNLNDFEKNLVSKVAKQHKVKGYDKSVIYDEGIKLIKSFCNSYRLLINLKHYDYEISDTSPDDEMIEDITDDFSKVIPEEKDGSQEDNNKIIIDLKLKLENYLKQYEDLYSQSRTFIYKFDTFKLNKYKIIRDIDLFINDNRNNIFKLIDSVYMLGKVTVQFDPDQTQGYF